jgi:outer membrane protein OmpA-like peptidoglycan-associated protein
LSPRLRPLRPRWPFWLGLAVLAVGCAAPPPPPPPKDRVVLLPSKDGGASALVIRSGGRETLVDQPYATATLSSPGVVGVSAGVPADVAQRYAPLLAEQPARPVSYVLYFVSGKDELAAASRPVLDQIREELRKRKAPEITVIGHTDRVGSEAYNDALALQRAQTMRQQLLADGIGDGNIAVAGRGEREPLVPTADEVDEPKNRRVEISIR